MIPTPTLPSISQVLSSQTGTAQQKIFTKEEIDQLKDKLDAAKTLAEHEEVISTLKHIRNSLGQPYEINQYIGEILWDSKNNTEALKLLDENSSANFSERLHLLKNHLNSNDGKGWEMLPYIYSTHTELAKQDETFLGLMLASDSQEMNDAAHEAIAKTNSIEPKSEQLTEEIKASLLFQLLGSLDLSAGSKTRIIKKIYISPFATEKQKAVARDHLKEIAFQATKTETNTYYRFEGTVYWASDDPAKALMASILIEKLNTLDTYSYNELADKIWSVLTCIQKDYISTLPLAPEYHQALAHAIHQVITNYRGHIKEKEVEKLIKRLDEIDRSTISNEEFRVVTASLLDRMIYLSTTQTDGAPLTTLPNGQQVVQIEDSHIVYTVPVPLIEDYFRLLLSFQPNFKFLTTYDYGLTHRGLSLKSTDSSLHQKLEALRLEMLKSFILESSASAKQKNYAMQEMLRLNNINNPEQKLLLPEQQILAQCFCETLKDVKTPKGPNGLPISHLNDLYIKFDDFCEKYPSFRNEQKKTFLNIIESYFAYDIDYYDFLTSAFNLYPEYALPLTPDERKLVIGKIRDLLKSNNIKPKDKLYIIEHLLATHKYSVITELDVKTEILPQAITIANNQKLDIAHRLHAIAFLNKFEIASPANIQLASEHFQSADLKLKIEAASVFINQAKSPLYNQAKDLLISYMRYKEGKIRKQKEINLLAAERLSEALLDGVIDNVDLDIENPSPEIQLHQEIARTIIASEAKDF